MLYCYFIYSPAFAFYLYVLTCTIEGRQANEKFWGEVKVGTLRTLEHSFKIKDLLGTLQRTLPIVLEQSELSCSQILQHHDGQSQLDLIMSFPVEQCSLREQRSLSDSTDNSARLMRRLQPVPYERSECGQQKTSPKAGLGKTSWGFPQPSLHSSYFKVIVIQNSYYTIQLALFQTISDHLFSFFL